MADQNCAHGGCKCKIEQGKVSPEAAIHTAVIIAGMLARLVRASVSVATRIAGNH